MDVEAFYLPDHSDIVNNRYAFGYHIRITNHTENTVQLERRHWFIEDKAENTDTPREVEGEGVVGEKPLIEPGDSHEYQSWVVLGGPVGAMRGKYKMSREDGSSFDAEVPTFELSMPRTLH